MKSQVKAEKIQRLLKSRDQLEKILSSLDMIGSLTGKTLEDLEQWERVFAKDSVGRSLFLTHVSRLDAIRIVVSGFRSLSNRLKSEKSKIKLAFDSTLNSTESEREDNG